MALKAADFIKVHDETSALLANSFENWPNISALLKSFSASPISHQYLNYRTNFYLDIFIFKTMT